MKLVVLEHVRPDGIMSIVRDLRGLGLVQGKDFDFSYEQQEWTTEEGVKPRMTKFMFYNEKWATWFTLKYL